MIWSGDSGRNEPVYSSEGGKTVRFGLYFEDRNQQGLLINLDVNVRGIRESGKTPGSEEL